LAKKPRWKLATGLKPVCQGAGFSLVATGEGHAMSDHGFSGTLGLQHLEDQGDDISVVALDAEERHLNPHGTVHGGAIATLCDSAMGAAVATGENAPVTIELTVTYLEPVPQGRVVAKARVRRRGSRITIVEADVTDHEGNDVAHAIGTFTTI
jgi:acyl-CoA thioesterase